MNTDIKRKVKLSEIKPSKNNPRVIKNKKYFELVESLKSFPEMQKIRTIVVDENMITLGGNQRLKAAKEAGMKEVWIDQAIGWNDKRKQEFIIKDNLSAGEWDNDILANIYELEELNAWGMDLLNDEDWLEINNPVNEETENSFATELDQESNYIILKFSKDIDWIQAKTLFNIKTETARRANGKEWSKGIGRVLNGVQAIKKIKNDN